MESSIISEMNTNYLLITSEHKSCAAFEEKMFEYNNIKGFLNMQTSRVNNNITYQYRLSDMESMERTFYNREFTMEDVKNIFTSITAVCRRACEYLLSTDAILLSPEYIFIRGSEYLFCYYPASENGFNKGLRELMEYILERLDHRDSTGVMKAYGLYQKILKNNFTMDTLMEEFEAGDGEENEKQGRYADNGSKIMPNTYADNSGKIMLNTYADNSQKKHGIDNINECKGAQNSGKSPAAASIEELEAELEADSKTGFIKRLFAGRCDRPRKKPRFMYGERVKSAGCEEAGTMLLAEGNSYNETQLLSGRMLISQSGGRDIMLTALPLRVGSKKEDCDFAIDNVMVSRNHAILTYECGFYYVEDNDSTNGTFVNGSKIPPYEPIEIKEGDTICFANEKYRLN